MVDLFNVRVTPPVQRALLTSFYQTLCCTVLRVGACETTLPEYSYRDGILPRNLWYWVPNDLLIAFSQGDYSPGHRLLTTEVCLHEQSGTANAGTCRTRRTRGDTTILTPHRTTPCASCLPWLLVTSAMA